MSITTTAHERIEINRDTLRFWKEEAGLHQPLALNVTSKVEGGQELSEPEQQVLCLGLTQEHVDFVKENLLVA